MPDQDWIRPLISGLVGSAITAWVLAKLASFAPPRDSAFDADKILAESKFRLFVANVLATSCILLGVLGYQTGIFRSNDWGGAALIIRVGSTLPTLFLFLSGFGPKQHKLGELLRAQATTAKTPLWLHYAIIVIGVFCLCAAAVRLLPG